MAQALIDEFDGVIFDLDGTVYVGNSVIDFAVEAIAECARRGLPIGYATNNASRTPEEVAANLVALGVQAEEDHITTSAQAGAAMLNGLVDPESLVLVVGGDAIAKALQAQGFRPVWSSQDQPQAVVQGFHPDVGWRNLAHGSVAVRSGAVWVATNRDLTIPTEWGIAPGNGTLVNAIASATGMQPRVAGKPFATLLETSATKLGSTRPLTVGDRLDTDIAAAHAANMASLMVLTGISGAAEICAAPPEQRATWIGFDLRALVDSPPTVSATETGFECSGWRTEITNGEVQIKSRGDRSIDGVNAVAHSAWHLLDSAGSPSASAQKLLAELIASGR